MTTVFYPYLGRAGALRRLPSRDSLSITTSRGETSHVLSGGGTAVTSRLYPKSTYSLTLGYLDSTESDLIYGFYTKSFGPGPYVFVHPGVRNVLPLDVANCGARSQAAHGWINSGGTLARTGTAPTAAPDSGVLTWSGLTASQTLQPGLVANVADKRSAPVYLPLEPVTCSLWVKASSSATMSLQLTGYDANGAATVTSAATSVAATTSWAQFAVTVAAGAGAFASAVFVLPRLVLGGTAPTTVSIAAAQLEYGDAATGWQIGYGSPRVSITTPPGREIQQLGYSNSTLVLKET